MGPLHSETHCKHVTLQSFQNSWTTCLEMYLNCVWSVGQTGSMILPPQPTTLTHTVH